MAARSIARQAKSRLVVQFAAEPWFREIDLIENKGEWSLIVYVSDLIPDVYRQIPKDVLGVSVAVATRAEDAQQPTQEPPMHLP